MQPPHFTYYQSMTQRSPLENQFEAVSFKPRFFLSEPTVSVGAGVALVKPDQFGHFGPDLDLFVDLQTRTCDVGPEIDIEKSRSSCGS